MIRNVPLTAIFVDDQEAALAFYTDKLGLEKIQDEPQRGHALDHGLARLARADGDLGDTARGRRVLVPAAVRS
jgi:catechol 2,3-dioxygenase-like lactoylglutathione lyase family enzyme